MRKALAATALAVTAALGMTACGSSGYDTSYQQDQPTYVYVHGTRTVVHHYHTVVVHHSGTRPHTSTGHVTVTKHTVTTVHHH